MNTRLCLKIAGRIDAGLQRELGEGIDLARMLADELYARDVLLVCDATREGELFTLGQEFRAAANAAAPAEARDSGLSSGFGFSPSRFFNSLFGSGDAPAPPGGAQHPPHSQAKARQRGGLLRRWR